MEKCIILNVLFNRKRYSSEIKGILWKIKQKLNGISADSPPNTTYACSKD